MKKLFVIFIIALCVMSCGDFTRKYYDVNVVYDVFYPDTVIRYDTIFTAHSSENDYEKYSVKAYINSYRGTNYISITPRYNNEFNRTTCPIRIISYKEIK